MEFLLVLAINITLPCRTSSRTLWYPFKRDDKLSTDLRDPKYTQLVWSPSTGILMLIPAILIEWKQPTIYMCPADVSGSSVPSIGRRTRHQIMHMITPWMAPGVSLTTIMLPSFGLKVALFALCLLTSTMFSLSRLRLDTLFLLNIFPLLVMTHFNMMTSLNVSPTT